MDYKGYHIEEERPSKFMIYRSYDAWVNGEKPTHIFSSISEAYLWIDEAIIGPAKAYNRSDYKKLLDEMDKLSLDEQRSSIIRIRDTIMNTYNLKHSDIIIDLLDIGAGEEEREKSINEWTRYLKAAGASNVYVYEVDEGGMITTSGDDYITVLTSKPISEEHAEILADIYYSWGVTIGPETGIPIYMLKAYGEKVWPKPKPQVGVIPKLPEEARGDFLFYEYVRDMAKYEALSEEDVQRMWEGWKRQ